MDLAASIRLGTLLFLALAGAASAQTVREQLKTSELRLYAVVFGATVGADSKLGAFRISKVIDSRSGTDRAVDVPVPETFIDAARKKFAAKPHEPGFKDGGPVETFTYYFYTPARPATVITDPDQPLDHQP